VVAGGIQPRTNTSRCKTEQTNTDDLPAARDELLRRALLSFLGRLGAEGCVPDSYARMQPTARAFEALTKTDARYGVACRESSLWLARRHADMARCMDAGGVATSSM